MKQYKKIPGREIIAAMIHAEMSAKSLGRKIGRDTGYVLTVCRNGVTGSQMAAFALALGMKKYQQGAEIL